MTQELTKAAQQALEAYDAFADADDFSTLFELTRKMNVLRELTAAQPAQTDSMGMPTSCGKPLCSPDEHHPLCKLHQPAAQATPEPLIVKGAMAGMVDAQVRDLWPTKGATLAPQQATPEPLTPDQQSALKQALFKSARIVEQATPEPVLSELQDFGPWSVSMDGRHIDSDNFKHDVKLVVQGDFRDDVQRRNYSLDIANRLSRSAATPETAGDRCAQCKKAYRQGAGVDGCPKCAPGVRVSEAEFQQPIHTPATPEPVGEYRKVSTHPTKDTK